MTLKDFKKQIDKLVKAGHGDLTVIYACDGEGNGYDDVYYLPAVMEVKDIEDVYPMKDLGVDRVICIN